VTLCNVVEVYRRFGGMYRFHLLGRIHVFTHRPKNLGSHRIMTWIIRKWDARMQTGFKCLRIGSCAVLLWALLWIFGYLQTGSISWPSEGVSASDAWSYWASLLEWHILSLVFGKCSHISGFSKFYSVPPGEYQDNTLKYATTVSPMILNLLIMAIHSYHSTLNNSRSL
jgi:hypothetical protein